VLPKPPGCSDGLSEYGRPVNRLTRAAVAGFSLLLGVAFEHREFVESIQLGEDAQLVDGRRARSHLVRSMRLYSFIRMAPFLRRRYYSVISAEPVVLNLLPR
jgi:hypothetical protein